MFVILGKLVLMLRKAAQNNPERSLLLINFKHKQRGFTLLEIIIVVSLLALMSLAVSRFYSNSLIASQTTQNTTDALWQGRLALARMVIDFRSIQSANAITVNTTNRLVFTDINGTSYDYQLSGTNLLCNSQVLARGVNSLTFSYYDKTGSVTSTVSNIRYIKISLTVTKNNTNFTITTSVYLRAMNT